MIKNDYDNVNGLLMDTLDQVLLAERSDLKLLSWMPGFGFPTDFVHRLHLYGDK